LSLTVLGMMRVKLRSYTAPRNCFRSAINSGEEFGPEYSSLSCCCPRLRSDVRRPPCSRALTQLPAPLFLNDSQFGRCFPLVPPARVFILSGILCLYIFLVQVVWRSTCPSGPSHVQPLKKFWGGFHSALPTRFPHLRVLELACLSRRRVPPLDEMNSIILI
jgi:hypothetical protein